MVKTAAVQTRMSWNDTGTSISWDLASLAFALALHAPLFFIKLDQHKKSVDGPSQRLVSIDLVEPEAPKPAVVEEAPPPPVEKENTLMARLKALVKKEPPPPVPVEKKPEPTKLADVPAPIPLKANLDLPEKMAPKLESKSGFKTAADPATIKQQQLAMNAAPTGIAPLSAKKLGTMDDRAAIKSNKGSFQVSRNESLQDIGGGGPGLAGAPAPTIAIRTGSSASTEKFSAPVTQKSNKGSIGAVPSAGLGGPQLSLRDQIIARDAAPSQINVGGRAGGVAGGVPAGTGSLATKRNAGSFQTPGAAGGLGTGSAGSVQNAAPQIAQIVPKKKEKQSMFTISGPLKDRKILKQVPPEYPDWAQAQGISASVVLEFTVDPSGVVKNSIVVRRTSGYPKLDQTAIEALKQWRFVPLDENREEIGQIMFNYSLS